MSQPGQGSVDPDGTPPQSGTGDPGNTDPQKPPTDPQSGGGDDKTGQPETVSKADLEAALARMRAADQNNAKLQAQLKEYQDKDLSAQEKAAKELAESQKARDEALARLRDLQIHNAFLADGTYKWRNPGTALKLLDLEGVTIGDDGKVQGMKAALDRLAKAEPYLLEDQKDTKKTPAGSTGVPPAGGQPTGGTDLKAAASRIPALRTRGVGN